MKKVLSKDGTAIAFERLGQGPALILVDGALCSRSFGPMPKLAPLLAPHFTVFMYDRRGRGESGDTKPYAKEREIEDIEALIKEAGGSAFAAGLSSGGALVLEAAARGLDIARLAVYEPPYMVDQSVPANHQARLEQMISSGRRSDALEYFMRDMVGIPVLFFWMMRLMPGVWAKLKAVAHTLPYDSAVMGDYSLPGKRFASITKRALAISGEKTDVRLRRAVQALAKVLPNVQHLTLKGQTHNVKAEVLTPALVEFFKS